MRTCVGTLTRWSSFIRSSATLPRSTSTQKSEMTFRSDIDIPTNDSCLFHIYVRRKRRKCSEWPTLSYYNKIIITTKDMRDKNFLNQDMFSLFVDDLESLDITRFNDERFEILRSDTKLYFILERSFKATLKTPQNQTLVAYCIKLVYKFCIVENPREVLTECIFCICTS